MPGLALRHWRMARAWCARGARVTFAWPQQRAETDFQLPDGCATLVLDTPRKLAVFIQRQRPDVVLLGYWELHDWLPRHVAAALVLDYVAPRLLERQFEDRERLAEDAAVVLPLLARCDEIWVGNRRQADLMLGWMILAGHDCRTRMPVRVVPIAGEPVQSIPPRAAGALKLFHGGRDWPWRNASRWLDAVRDAAGPWYLLDFSEQGGYGSWAEYHDQLSRSDLLLELADDNVERRFSQSFRVADALCAGVPVICNRFLPMAAAIDRVGAGWVIDEPAELAALLQSIAADRGELARRAGNALALARRACDAGTIYAGLLKRLVDLDKMRLRAGEIRRPLPIHTGSAGTQTRRALVESLNRFVHFRLRVPFHRLLGARLAGRPRPGPGGTTWIVVSRADLFPAHHGAAVKIERTAWGLSFHVDEVLLLTDRRDCYWRYVRGERQRLNFPPLARLPGWPRRFNRLRLMLKGLPRCNAFLYLPLVDRGLHIRLMWLLRRHPVAVVQGEFPAYAHPAVWAARLFGTRAVMVEHNVEYQRIADQVDELGAAVRSRLKRIEVDLANACDRVVTVSDRDREQLVKAGVQPGRIRTIPHGVDLERFDNARPENLRRRYNIPVDHALLVYHGIYSYAPNLAAVEELAAEILPRLAAAGCLATVIAIGPEPPEKPLGGVVFTGAIDDLAGHLKAGDLAVIPLRTGGGTRMKILDDFAAGLPVVTTAKGMEGIAVKNGAHLLVAESADQIAAAVVDLLEHPERRQALADAARSWVADYDWRVIAARYVDSVTLGK